MPEITKDKRRGLYRLDETFGKKLNKKGEWVPDRKTFYGKTKKEIAAKRDKYLQDKAQGIERRDQYFGILADTWIKNSFMMDGETSASTKRAYHDPWRLYLKPLPLYNMPLNEVTTMTIQQSYNQIFESGCPTSQITKINKLMRKFYAYVESEGYGRDVTRSLKIPKESKILTEKEITVWSDDEIKAIFEGFQSADNRFRLRFLIVLAFYTGCRIAELLALTYDDITENGIRINKQLGNHYEGIEGGKVKVSRGLAETKTKSSVRTMPINQKLLDEFQIHKSWHLQEKMKNGYRNEDNLIFTTDEGLPLDQQNVKRSLYRYYEKIGVPKKPIHTYRHTFGTNLCRAGVPIQTASTLLGHSDISVTAKYYVNVSAAEKLNAIKQLETFLN